MAPPEGPTPAKVIAPFVPNNGADLGNFSILPADNLLNSVYGDHPHHNDGCHLDGSILRDTKWQHNWKRVMQLPLTQYTVPHGSVGKQFLAILAREFEGVYKCTWNSERLIVFAATILQTMVGVSMAKDI